jgi:hypothetical protein
MKGTKPTPYDTQVNFAVPKCMAIAIATAANKNFEPIAAWLRNAALTKLRAAGIEIDDAA